MARKHALTGRESLRNMTVDDAQAILKTTTELEFPKLYEVSMVMALFSAGSAQKCLCDSLLTDLDV